MKTKITIIASFILLMSASLSFGQKKDWGVGVKLGDPTGFSLKKYLDNDNALELILGRPYYWGGYNYNYHFKNNNKFKNKGYYYGNSYGNSFPISLQLRYLIHKDIKPVDGLQWYFGFGGQFRFQNYRYYYYDTFGYQYSASGADIGFGADGVGGVEYTFKNAPFSVAADANIYIEFFDQPFLILFQPGVTGRYNF